jgi:hypothetical protein
MKTTRLMAVAALIAATGPALHVGQAQQVGARRTISPANTLCPSRGCRGAGEVLTGQLASLREPTRLAEAL